MNTITVIIAIISAIGGWEFIKYILDWIKNNKKSKISDKKDEFETDWSMYKEQMLFLQTQIELLQGQLKKRDLTVTELTSRVDDLNTKIDDLLGQLNGQEPYICYNADCANRKRIKI